MLMGRLASRPDMSRVARSNPNPIHQVINPRAYGSGSWDEITSRLALQSQGKDGAALGRALERMEKRPKGRTMLERVLLEESAAQDDLSFYLRARQASGAYSEAEFNAAAKRRLNLPPGARPNRRMLDSLPDFTATEGASIPYTSPSTNLGPNPVSSVTTSSAATSAATGGAATPGASLASNAGVGGAGSSGFLAGMSPLGTAVAMGAVGGGVSYMTGGNFMQGAALGAAGGYGIVRGASLGARYASKHLDRGTVGGDAARKVRGFMMGAGGAPGSGAGTTNRRSAMLAGSALSGMVFGGNRRSHKRGFNSRRGNGF